MPTDPDFQRKRANRLARQVARLKRENRRMQVALTGVAAAADWYRGDGGCDAGGDPSPG